MLAEDADPPLVGLVGGLAVPPRAAHVVGGRIGRVGPDGLVAVDWEFAHVGDPREDLGWFMAAAMAAPPDPISYDLDAFCTRYRELTGMSEEVVNPWSLLYFVVLGAVRIFSNLIAANAALMRGEVASITVPYNVNAAAFAHGAWLGAIAGLEAMGAP